MEIEFDLKKSNKNLEERDLPFDLAKNFEWESALYIEDDRKDYPEKRFIALGFLNNRLHVICFTLIKDGVRIISFRKANAREVKRYEKEITNQ